MFYFKFGGVFVNILFCVFVSILLCFILCVCVNIFVFCMFCVFIYLTVVYNFFLKKKITLGVRTYSCTFDRALGAAFDLSLVSSTVAPFHTRTALHAYVRTCLCMFERITHTHTHAPARVRSNVLLYVRTYSVLGQCEQFLGQFFFLFPHFLPTSRTAETHLLRPSPP
jgi:hypothetical protein